MSIDFSPERWEKIRRDYTAWWAGDLKRPLVHIELPNAAHPRRPEPMLPSKSFHGHYDLSVSAEDIVDRMDYDLSCCKFLGDGYPSVWPNFGPGFAACFLGATLEKGSDTIWFRPQQLCNITDIRFEYDSKNQWLTRVKDICRAAMQRWEGSVQVGMTDLGGTLDILSTFRPSESLLFDLYDHPDVVKNLNWQIHDLWWRYYDEIDNTLQPINPGYTAWSPIFSLERYYMLQCDFAYMISPEMFDEFVKPELAASCRKLSHAFYHLDGPGQLPHLDSLLSIPELKGIQWIPGAGAPDCSHWPEVYRKIRDAGKLIEVRTDNLKIFDTVIEQLGSGEGLIAFLRPDSESEAKEFLDKHHIQV